MRRPATHDPLTTEHPEPLLSLEHAEKSFGAVRALADGDIALLPRRGSRAGRRERRGQVDAGEDPRRRPPARRRSALVDGDGDDLRQPGGARRPPGSRSSSRSRRCSLTSRVAENIFIGTQPLARWRRIDRGGCTARARELFTRLGVRLDPDRPARGLSVADQQIVEIAKALSFERHGAGDGRAHRRADPRRGRAAVRRRRDAAGRRARRCCSSPTGSRRSSHAASASR